jgi:peroxiredoxin
MANPLTGGYEAVVQIAIRQINGLLGTLHQNADQDAPLKLLHSTIARVGDPPRRRPGVGAFGDWVIAYQKTGPCKGLNDVRAELTTTAPPGVARTFSEAFDVFDKDWVVAWPPDSTDLVRGVVKLQVGSVTITVPEGSSSEVTIHADVRAQYYPDPDTTEMPQPVHGEVRAAFDVIKLGHGTGRRLLIQPSAQDAKIQFTPAPGSGLTAADADRISTQVRKFLREGMSLLPIDLPADFVFGDFKGLGFGWNHGIALPLQLSGAAAPANGLQSITQSFIGSSGFGFAVSKEYVNTLIDLGAIRAGIEAQRVVFRVGAWGVYHSVTYTLRFSSGPTLTFKSGGIEIAGRIEAETGTSWAPNGYVSFKQLVTLVLNADTQAFDLERVGDPDVDESFFIPHGRAVDSVGTQIDIALASNRTEISGIFAGAKSKLIHALRTFDSGAWASYTGVEITTAGVIVRGEITGGARRAPVAQIGETHQGAAFTALESWIPAGRIDRFVWSWVEYSGLASIWSGVEKSLVDEHRFILPKPAGVTNVSQICLRLEGVQITASGQVVSIAGGTTCHVQEPGYAVDIPPWWAPLTIPFWSPQLADTGPLRQAIAGHMSVQASSPRDAGPPRNTLVYFVDSRAKRPFDSLIKALSESRNSSSVVTTVVLPSGTFDAPRSEVESKLGLPHEGVPPLHFTEDDEGGWTRTFGVSKTPSIYLINARREFVWKHEGEPDSAAVAAALDRYEIPSAPLQFRPLRLTVSPGDAAPDATFEDGGHQYALHRLRGRDVLLNFWQSWSAPCLTELQRLQRLHQGPEAPFIVAFHGGAKSEEVDEVRKRFGLSYPLAQDSQQQLARRYGVRCWPTTIKIDTDGRVEHVQFGIAHEHQPPRVSDESTTAV